MRDIDRLIDYIREASWLSPTEAQVLVNRVEPVPTKDEFDRARAQLYPDLATRQGEG